MACPVVVHRAHNRVRLSSTASPGAWWWGGPCCGWMLGVRTTAEPLDALDALDAALRDLGPVIIACSGGIDSLLLATVAHRRDPGTTVVGHTVTPAVPSEGTARVVTHARDEGWDLRLVRSREFDDERYLANPTDRCYYCKTNLYDALVELGAELGRPGVTVLSGANLDDLGEYRPGLQAAAEHGVRHPYVEAGIDKAEIRAMARVLELPEAELPASPCLASRLYTGTRVTAARLHAVELGEAVLRGHGHDVARCRIRTTEVMVEVPDADRDRISEELLDDVTRAMRAAEPTLTAARLDPQPYRPGRAVLHLR